MKVGLIGLGRMGQGMAGRILTGKHDLKVYNRSVDKAKSLVDAGATLARTVTDACTGSEVVITMVADDKALREVTTGAGGICETLAKGAIHVCMGTHSAGAIQEMRDAHDKTGQKFVCAPVLGRPDAAAAGQLGIVAAGPQDAIDKCRPLFELMGKRLFEAGPEQPGAAVVKLSNNMVLACALQAMAEGFSLVRKYGVEAQVLHEVMSEGLFAAPSYKAYGKIMADENYDQVGFTATLGLKDSVLIMGAADSARVPLPGYQAFRNALLSAIGHGDAEKDWAVVAKVQAKLAGLE